MAVFHASGKTQDTIDEFTMRNRWGAITGRHRFNALRDTSSDPAVPGRVYSGDGAAQLRQGDGMRPESPSDDSWRPRVKLAGLHGRPGVRLRYLSQLSRSRR